MNFSCWDMWISNFSWRQEKQLPVKIFLQGWRVRTFQKFKVNTLFSSQTKNWPHPFYSSIAWTIRCLTALWIRLLWIQNKLTACSYCYMLKSITCLKEPKYYNNNVLPMRRLFSSQPAWDVFEISQSDLHWERYLKDISETPQKRSLFCDVF